MPTYEYICTECSHEFEAFQRMSDPALTDCPDCGGGKVRRKIGKGAGIIFKGGGFYETDFKDKKGGGSSTGAKQGETTSSEPAKPAEAKKETAPAASTAD